ncbi:MAG: hypothetical protein AB9891_13405 [Anaerolineaceae bacterium]
MNFINFMVWLSAGAMIGWFASRMVQMERKRIGNSSSIVNSDADES